MPSLVYQPDTSSALSSRNRILGKRVLSEEDTRPVEAVQENSAQDKSLFAMNRSVMEGRVSSVGALFQFGGNDPRLVDLLLRRKGRS